MSPDGVEPFRPVVDLQIDYAAELNPQQHEAVTSVPGPSLVIAGAGSGKTKTLTYRVAFLLEQGIPPERILLLTFTNKAAREMMRRVTELVGRELRELWGGTFHSIGARLLRRHAEAAGYRRDFTILDREDVNQLLKGCLVELKLDGKSPKLPKADVLADLLSMALNKRCPLQDVLKGDYEEYERIAEPLTRLAEHFAKLKRETNVVDFDDLLFLPWRLLNENADLREYYQRRFQFILVDEYQDTNPLQSDLIDLLAQRHQNVMAVGDDAQSIYSWRGADFRNILEFPRRYPAARVYKIETNYRSTPEILTLANASIETNIHQFQKTLEAHRRSGSKPAQVVCADAEQQAQFVAHRALRLREEGVSLGRMAVLYRSHFHALALQLELTRRRIPFSITSGIRFFEQAHIKDVAAYLRVIYNPRDEAAFLRLAQMLPGIGEKSARKLWRAFSAQWQGWAANTIATLADSHPAPPEAAGPAGPPGGMEAKMATALAQCAAVVPAKARAAWEELTLVLSQLAMMSNPRPSELIQCVLEGSYRAYLIENYANHVSRMTDLQNVISFANGFPRLEEFLTQLSLLSDGEGEETAARRQEDLDTLRLSTVHQAKGLEFDVVFVIMLCEGAFPSVQGVRTPEGEEEERRLFYVAVTRARNELYLSWPLYYNGSGSGGQSRFVRELPSDLMDVHELNFYG